MDQQFYRTLLLLVNHKKIMGDIQSYVNARIDILRDHLETSSDLQRISKIQGAKVKPKETIKVEAVNTLKVILTKDDLGAMINTMDVVYNLMDDTNTATLKMEGSKETGTFWDVSSTCSERGATTPFY
ncbi:hypothetical protein N9P57_00770 [Planktomarina temperata]|jgi:hypothetical protein|nr:hypothetical protein [Planktomarina temperata]MDA9813297.1 hypothetical protein [Planktomarina temperata]MDC3340760.1 hypothetical protein [Planktomarina temperata]